MSDSVTILSGGVTLTVKHEDGRTEDVLVRKIPMRQMQDLGHAWGKEPEEIDLYAGKPAGWHATLIEDSWNHVMDVGREMNAVPFGKWYARQLQAAEAINKDVRKTIAEAVTSLQPPLSS